MEKFDLHVAGRDCSEAKAWRLKLGWPGPRGPQRCASRLADLAWQAPPNASEITLGRSVNHVDAFGITLGGPGPRRLKLFGSRRAGLTSGIQRPPTHPTTTSISTTRATICVVTARTLLR